jgi:hypothetical protein
MPALNFAKQFADAVEIGEKRQTVRAPRKDGRAHCKRGDTIKLYTGMRTAGCRLLAEATVTCLARIRIEPTCMYLDGRLLLSSIYDRECEQTDSEFAVADGFAGFTEMADWFEETHGLPFEGVLIQWDELR